jgi:hypothetical protein|tara:strand:- start:416 stop:730 length:315 start_codon:yes stop_codon:yes gene_type:complete
VAIDALIASIFSTYGVSGVLTVVSVYLLTKLYYLERRYTKLEIDLSNIQKSLKEDMSDTRNHLAKRAKEVDANIRSLDGKLDALVNWAISTAQGDVGWLQKRNK